MRLRLKTKFTLTTALLVLSIVALISSVYVARLTRQVLRDADLRAKFVAQQVFLQAQHALQDAAEQGATPASDRLNDLREFVRQALEENAGLTSLIDAAVGMATAHLWGPECDPPVGKIAASFDVVAADRVGCDLLGKDW